VRFSHHNLVAIHHVSLCLCCGVVRAVLWSVVAVGAVEVGHGAWGALASGQVGVGRFDSWLCGSRYDSSVAIAFSWGADREGTDRDGSGDANNPQFGVEEYFVDGGEMLLVLIVVDNG